MSQYHLESSEDFEKFYQLYLYSFNSVDEKRRRDYFFERCRHGLVYGLKKNGTLTSGLYSLPFQVDFHGTKYFMNGIGDVATAPESAGKGGASTLLQTTLNEMQANKVTLSYLAPFSYDYYRRFGYEQVFNHMQYSIVNKNIPKFRPLKSQGSVVRGKMKDHLEDISRYYSFYSKNGLKGGLIREKWWWDYLPIKNDWTVGVYYDEKSQVQGYVIYELNQSSIVIKEMLYSNSIAFENLLAFVFNHKNSVQKFIFDSADPVYHGDWFHDPNILNVRILPYMMVRIVDIKDFMLRYPFRKKDFGPIKFGIEDDNLQQNAGVWELSSKDGKVTLNRLRDLMVDDAEKITIQEFTKALFGTEKLKNIVIGGKARLNSETVEQLDKIFVDDAPEFVDYF